MTYVFSAKETLIEYHRVIIQRKNKIKATVTLSRLLGNLFPHNIRNNLKAQILG